MDLSSVLQFYAPIVGIIGLAYWSGVLAARVRHLEKEVFSEASQRNRADDHDRLVKVEANTTSIHEDVHQMKSTMISIQRQLGNLMAGKAGAYEIHALVEGHER